MDSHSNCYPIEVYIPTSEEKVAGKIVTFYQMELRMNGRSWQMEKRYSEFNDLNMALKGEYADLPFFPGKGYFKLNAEALIQRRTNL